ncbi:MAG: carboxymuconolactone decarboxylase family protein [Xanthobacteraceae bacterium]
MPTDIDPQSGFRLPLPKREDLDDAGKAVLDRVMGPEGKLADLQGPVGAMLYSTKVGTLQSALNRYLRYEAGFTPRIREIAILTAAREADSQFEWVQHEAIALREGMEPAIINVIRHRKSTQGLDEADAAVIEFGRQLLGQHKVAPEMFARIKKLFGPHKTVDLAMLMGNYTAMAAVLTAVDMQLRLGQKPLLPIP